MLAKRYLTIAIAGILLLGMKAWAEPMPLQGDNLLDDLAPKFRPNLERFQTGMSDPALVKNYSLEAMLLRRAMLVLQNTAEETSDVKALKDFPEVEKLLRDLIAKEPKLEKLKNKKALTVGELSQVERLLLETKDAPELELMGKLAVVVDVETEKTLEPKLTTEQILSKLARRKLAVLPREALVLAGEGTPLTRKINEALKGQFKEKNIDRLPTFADLSKALKKKKLVLTPAGLLELNASLAPTVVQQDGGISANETLRQLYRGFAKNLNPVDRGGLKTVEDFFNRFEAKIPQRPFDRNEGVAPLKRLMPFANLGSAPGNGGRGGSGGNAGLLQGNQVDRGSSFPFSNAIDAFSPQALNAEERQCLENSVQNAELILSFTSKPGSQTHCSSTAVSENPIESRSNPKHSKQKGLEDKCEVDYLTAKHCIEPGDLESLSIRGVNEPISHAQILVANYNPSVTGGDDVAVIRTVMSCESAANVRYIKPATNPEATDALINHAAVMIARNRNVNVQSGQPNFLFARGYLPTNQGEFGGFSLTSQGNAGQRVIQGDSGGPQVACIGNEPKVIGATSTILVTNPGQHGGNLGRAASLGSLDWLGGVLRGASGTPTESVARSFGQKKGADKIAHPTI